MNDRFAPNSSSLKPLYTLINTLQADEFLINAFSEVVPSKSEIKSIAEVKRHLTARMDMTPTTPWILFDTIAKLMTIIPLALKESLAEKGKIETGHRYEHLRITTDGRWQIAWEIDPQADPEEREVALNWYIPPNQKDAPIVPAAIIDYIASSVILLREGLILPAATTLSIALEAALWDALEYSGFSRYSEQITYSLVKWHLEKKMHDKFLVSIEGADRSVKELNTDDGSTFSATLELRKMQTRDSSEVIGAKVDIDKRLASFLVSDHDINEGGPKDLIKDKGLSIAIQKARKERMRCLEIVPDFLDQTLISLRNSLVHIPSHGKLDEPIPIEGQSGLKSVDDLRNNPRFVRSLLFTVADIINIVYADQIQVVEESTAHIELTETGMQQLDFWTRFKEFTTTKKTKLKLRKPRPQHWYDISIGSSNAHIALTLNSVEDIVTCELYIPQAKELFNRLYADKEQIETELGEKPHWMELPGKKASRIRIVHSADTDDFAKWNEYFAWLLQETEKFHKVFGKIT